MPHTCYGPRPSLASCLCSVHHCTHCYSNRVRYHVLTLSTMYFVVVRGCKQGRHIVAPSRARAGRRDGKHSLPAVCLPPCSSAPDALSGPRQKILFAALLRRDGYPALLSRCSCLSLQVPLAATSGCRHSTDMILRPPNHHPSAEAISEAVGRLRRPCILCAKTSLFQSSISDQVTAH